jgi:hypothetical protein
MDRTDRFPCVRAGRPLPRNGPGAQGLLADLPPPVFRGDTVWAVVRDEFEVPHVVRFHIQHGEAGGG